MTGAAAHHRPADRAFTLIEALMAIFILAIGFLSLAAIFPAGIELQRRGSDDLEGVTAASEIYGEILSNPLLNSDRLNEGFSSMIRENTDADAFPNAWMPDWQENPGGSVDPVVAEERDGWIEFTVLVDVQNDDPLAPRTGVDYAQLTFHESLRLWPSLADPRLVWDLFVRRPESEDPATLVTAAQHMAGEVQLALILRRVDPEFRRILQETTDVDPFDLPRPPLWEDDDPSDYEEPQRTDGTRILEYDADEPRGRRFRWIGTDNEMLSALRQPRQWLLDSDGNAWKIARIREVSGEIYFEFATEPTAAQAERFNDVEGTDIKALRFIYCETPPVLIDVRTFKTGTSL